MDGPRVRSALGLFVLEFVELGEDIDRNPNVIVVKTLDAVRVVKQDVGVEDEIFSGNRVAALPGARFLPAGTGAGFKFPEQRWLLAVYRNKRVKMLHEKFWVVERRIAGNRRIAPDITGVAHPADAISRKGSAVTLESFFSLKAGNKQTLSCKISHR